MRLAYLPLVFGDLRYTCTGGEQHSLMLSDADIRSLQIEEREIDPYCFGDDDEPDNDSIDAGLPCSRWLKICIGGKTVFDAPTLGNLRVWCDITHKFVTVRPRKQCTAVAVQPCTETRLNF